MEQSNHFKAGMVNAYSAGVSLGSGQSSECPRVSSGSQGCILFTNGEDTVEIRKGN